LALIRKWGQHRTERLRAFLTQQFVVHPFDERLCDLWAEVMAESRTMGKQLQTADAWIAATALSIDAPLATHNAKDFGTIARLRIVRV
jgi:predicted nucleic acid-binding protein